MARAPAIQLEAASDGGLVVLKAGFIRVVCELLDDEQLVVVLQIVRDSELKRAVLGLSGAMRHTLRRSPVDWQL